MANTINILKPSVCFEVQKIIGISTSDGNRRSYQVQWAPSWISGVHLVGCEDLIEEFEQEENNEDIQLQRSNIQEKISTEVVQNNSHYERSADFHTRVSETSNIEFQYVNRNAENVQHSSFSDKLLSFKSGIPFNSDNQDANYCDSITPSESEFVELNDHGYSSGCQLLPSMVYNTDCSKGIVKCEEALEESNVDSLHNNEGDAMELVIDMPVSKGGCSPMEGGCSPTEGVEDLTTNNTLTKAFKCNVCNKIFSHHGIFSQHIKTHTNDTKVYYECPVCNRKFKYKYSLQKHNLIGGGKCFSCKVCPKICTNDEELQAHITENHTKGRRFPCTYCMKLFPTITRLKNHVMVHTGERPFECHVCKKRFRRKDNLTDHSKRLHVGKRVRLKDRPVINIVRISKADNETSIS